MSTSKEAMLLSAAPKSEAAKLGSDSGALTP
jgi:hypothetical protein